MNRIVYISRCYRNLTSAGNKAKTDNERTLDAMGAVNLGRPMSVSANKAVNFFANLAGVVRFALKVKAGDQVVLQYPVKKYFSFLCRTAHRRGATVTALIHDLGSFRRRKLTAEKEIARLSHADTIIAANEAMRQWLIDHGMKRKVVALGVYDYRADAHNPHTEYSCQSMRRIVYAGSLSNRKNSFLLDLPVIADHFKIQLYGDKHNLHGLEPHPNIAVDGFKPAETFIGTVDADFGLVWDGDSIDSCSGVWGEYLKVNSPHKVSFYLRSGVPVVVWRGAGVASVIEHEGVGIVVDSLRDLPTAVAALTDADLAAMKQRTVAMAEKLDSGHFFRSALHAAGVGNG